MPQTVLLKKNLRSSLPSPSFPQTHSDVLASNVLKLCTHPLPNPAQLIDIDSILIL